MSENRRFKSKYDELREGNPARKDRSSDGSSPETENKYYDTPSTARTICFAWPDGRMQFFNYSYLVSGELNVADETNSIILSFTSHIVTLKGYNLGELFSGIMNQAPSLITQIDLRYTSSNNDEAAAIIEITIEQNEKS